MKTYTKAEAKLITRRAELQRELAVVEAKLGTKESK
jgi:hypothetical protein